MLEFLKDSIVGFSLLAFAALVIGPVIWRASRALARQGLLFALICCGFLVSMASKPGPTPVPTHIITYENTGKADNPNPESFAEDEDVVFAPLADVEGFAFAGWTPTGIAKGTTSNVTVTANWTETPPGPTPPPPSAPETNTVTFVLGDHGKQAGGGALVQQVEEGQSAEPPLVQADAGYAFACWDGSYSNVVADVSVTARYDLVEYRIAYANTKGAANANPTVFTVEDEVAFAALADVEGFAFAGWTPTGIARGTTSNVTVTANWTETPPDPTPPPPSVPETNTVTFVLGDHGKRVGGGALVQQVEEGQSAEPPLVQADEGYSFVGWDGSYSNVIADVTVTANWTETPPDPTPPPPLVPETNTVTFVLGDHGKQAGGGALVQQVEEGQSAESPLVQADAGYAFAGWDGCYSNVVADVSVTARYDVVEYRIAYANTKGAANANPTVFTVEDEVAFAALADVEGFAFAGWTPAGIAKGTTNDVVVTARWEAIEEPDPWDYELVTGEPMTPVALDLAALFGEDAAQAKSVAVKGLPSGLKYKDYVISGTPKKSGVSTATVTLTTTAGKKLTAALTFVVRTEGEHVVVAPCDAARGKVAGQGVYAPGKNVTLKATANKGYVFAGWYDGDDQISRLASYAFTMPEADVVLEAAFITVEEDRAAISVSVDGLPLSDARGETNVMAGVSLAWPVDVEALSETTVKVSGLPSGLKFTAKDVVDRKTGDLIAQANTIYGTPTAASKPGKPSAVKITVTTAGKTKREFALSVTVTELSAWAVGTFNGGSSVGQVSLTVAETGKTSGKWLTEGLTWTLSATGYDSHLEASEGNHETLFATLQAKCGKETAEIVIGVTPYGLTGYDGTGILFTADSFDWKTGELKELGAKMAKAPALTYDAEGFQPGTVTLKFGANGTVKVTGQFLDEETGKQLKASGSAVLCPMDEEYTQFCVYVYLPAKGVFEGYSEVVDLIWNGTTFSR